MNIEITNLALSPGVATTANLGWKPYGSASDFTLFATAVPVNADGSLPTPQSFTYDATTYNEGVTLMAETLCSMLPYTEDADCKTYTVDNTHGFGDSTASYTDCNGNAATVFVPVGSSTSVCSLTVPTGTSFTSTPVSHCVPTTTTTTTAAPTVHITSTLSGKSVTDVTGITGFTLSGTVTTGGTQDGYHSAFTGAISVTLSGTNATGAGNIALTINGVLQECQNIPQNTAGQTYTFASHSYLATDLINIGPSNGTC